MDKVIYYPYINVPQNAWFTTVLLYWDEVGSIIPSDILNSDDINNYVRSLNQV